jgi:hypothetical protein
MTLPKRRLRAQGWPEPFLRAKEIIEPILFAAGLRLAGVEQGEGRNGHAFAEYRRTGERLRLVWEGEENVLWIEAARERDAQIISRWTDIEWILAGRRLGLNPDQGDSRIAELVLAVGDYLERGERAPTVPLFRGAELEPND